MRVARKPLFFIARVTRAVINLKMNIGLVDIDGDSWPVPEMDSIGFEELPSYPLLNTNAVQPIKEPRPFGYVPRYISWKTSVDVVRGAFIEDFHHGATHAKLSCKHDARKNQRQGQQRLS